MRKLKGVHLKGYKAIQDIRLTNFERINYLVGTNGSGKSSIFEVLSIPSVFVKSANAGAIAVPMYGDLNRIIHDNFYFELSFDDDAMNIVTMNVTDHHNLSIQDANFTRTYPPDNPTSDSGLNSQDWMANILDANATGEEMSIDLKSNYDFSRDVADDPEAIRKFLNSYYAKESEYVRNVVKSITAANTIEFEITSQADKSVTLRYESLRSVSSGYMQLLGLYFSIRQKLQQFSDQAKSTQRVAIVCIEEPGQGLHPGLQKKLPMLFSEILEDDALSNVVLIVTTHSPFIISAACNQDDQKTYLIKDGYTVNLAEDVVAESSGYASDECLNVAAKMLDAGFEDIAPTPSTKESVKIVYCEGASKKVKDSDIYTAIFADETERYLFISTGGYTDAVNAYYAARASAEFVFGAGSSALALLDRSCSFSDIRVGIDEYVAKTGAGKLMFTDHERKKILKSDIQAGYRMLKRKEIENYLFDPVVVALLPKAKQAIWKDAKLKSDSQTPESIDYKSGEVKDYLKADADKIEAAKVIRNNKDNATKAIYTELLQCLSSAT